MDIVVKITRGQGIEKLEMMLYNRTIVKISYNMNKLINCEYSRNDI
ncbi:hypothetical protein [Clostridium sp. OS1-26]|nr:hypothetical protein [Clostridium sp. OS1-26]WML36730.1 hypothetical protein RCG18_08935 [Clostridium sp. OS1-26]